MNVETLYQLEKRMQQIVGALALPCPLEYFDVLQRLFELVLHVTSLQGCRVTHHHIK